MKNAVIYPGTFDPITFGHIDLIERASRLFDHIIIAVVENKQKTALFSLAERVDLAKAVLADFKNIEVDCFDGLLTDYAKQKGVNIIIRGIRVVSDFDYEFQMASMNRALMPKLETVFLAPSDRYTYVSSTLVRVIASSPRGDVSKFVPPLVVGAIKKKYGNYN